MHIHFIIHESFESPGAILDWANQRKYTIGFSRVYAGEHLPDTIDEIDLLIVMGGPQSPDTTLQECPYFDAAAEKDLIKRCIKDRKAVLGICLGAQLIGEALGAKYEHSPEKEIGFFPITFAEGGIQNKKFTHFGKTFEVGHWHNDMPGLTSESKVIAFSEGCPRQIIEYSSLVYGFQCHIEFTQEVVTGLIAHSEEELKQSISRKFVQQSDIMLGKQCEEMNRMLFSFLDKLVEEYRKPRTIV